MCALLQVLSLAPVSMLEHVQWLESNGVSRVSLGRTIERFPQVNRALWCCLLFEWSFDDTYMWFWINGGMLRVTDRDSKDRPCMVPDVFVCSTPAVSARLSRLKAHKSTTAQLTERYTSRMCYNIHSLNLKGLYLKTSLNLKEFQGTAWTHSKHPVLIQNCHTKTSLNL